MAPILSPPAISRTRPMKLATPPMPWRPSVKRAISAPTSKSSRWTRIIASASGDRREQRDLVIGAHGVAHRHVFLIDRDTHHREILERLGEARAPPLEPAQERGHVHHLGGRLDALLGEADLGTQPGEIKDLHGF